MKKYTILIFIVAFFSLNIFGQNMFSQYQTELLNLKNEHYSLIQSTTNVDSYIKETKIINQKVYRLYKNIDAFISSHNNISYSFRQLRKEIQEFEKFTQKEPICDCHTLYKKFINEYRGNVYYIKTHEGVVIELVEVGNLKWYHAYASNRNYSYGVETIIIEGEYYTTSKFGLLGESEVFHIALKNSETELYSISLFRKEDIRGSFLDTHDYCKVY